MIHHGDVYRKLFLDYHTQENAAQVGRDFHAEAWAESLAKAGVEAVSSIAKCGYGWRYYRKGSAGRVHPHLPEGMDILGETVTACHKRGIGVIAYVHTFGSEYLARERPELAVHRVDGSLCGNNICMLGPALEEELLPLLEDIAGQYDVDGLFLDGTYFAGEVCFCASCRKRFLDETGLPLPESRDAPSAGAYARWVTEAFHAVRRRCRQAAHRGNPDVEVCFNWVGTPRQPEPIPEDTGFLTADIIPANMAQYMSYVARYWALSGTSFDVMNHMSLKWWQEWGVKSPYALKQECALALANGGKTWVGYQMYPGFGVHPALLETLRETFDFVRDLETAVRGAEPVGYVAALHDPSAARAKPLDACSAFADETSLLGVHMAMTRSGIPYHSVTEETLRRRLGEFRAVILSGDQPVSPDTVAALTDFVQDGGGLLVTGKTGMVDADGAFIGSEAMCSLLGVDVREGYRANHGYVCLPEGDCAALGIPAMPLLCGAPFLLAKAREARELAELRTVYLRDDGRELYDAGDHRNVFSPPGERTGTSALTVRHLGKGTVVYAAADLFAAYYGSSGWAMRRLLRHLVNHMLLGERAIRLTAPDYVEMALTRKDGALTVHLTNLCREAPAMNFESSAEYVIGEEPIAIHGILLSVPLDRKPDGVYDALTGMESDWSWGEGRALVKLPPLAIHACLCFR